MKLVEAIEHRDEQKVIMDFIQESILGGDFQSEETTAIAELFQAVHEGKGAIEFADNEAEAFDAALQEAEDRIIRLRSLAGLDVDIETCYEAYCAIEGLEEDEKLTLEGYALQEKKMISNLFKKGVKAKSMVPYAGSLKPKTKAQKVRDFMKSKKGAAAVAAGGAAAGGAVVAAKKDGEETKED